MTAQTGRATKLVTLQRRSEFLRIRNALRWATAAFVLEAKSREGWSPPVPVPAEIARFGFTVTKQLGGAVKRNRIRRRLKAVVSLKSEHARPGFDYVVIARAAAGTRIFADLLQDFELGFDRLHSRPPKPRGEHGGSKSQRKSTMP